MANPEHVAKLKEGVEAWNAWRRRREHKFIEEDKPDFRQANFGGADFSRADLSGANFSDADLSRAYLDNADLDVANFSCANLSGASLGGANLSGAILTSANLSSASFGNTNLSRADLTGALLTGAALTYTNLSRAVLKSADIAEAHLFWAVFAGTDLSMMTGLESCHHVGPSIVDPHTLALSGKLPLEFLRGCGLSDTLIEYIPSIFGRGIEFQSCFISYSKKDQEFADRLYADLQNKGVRCWFAPHDIQGGKKIYEQIDRAIQMHDRLLLILSEDSMKSPWVKTEIRKARKREASESRRMLFPVSVTTFEKLRDWECFDADCGTDSAAEIREYFVPDFSGWKDHDLYQRALERLVRDFKAK